MQLQNAGIYLAVTFAVLILFIPKILGVHRVSLQLNFYLTFVEIQENIAIELSKPQLDKLYFYFINKLPTYLPNFAVYKCKYYKQQKKQYKK